MTIWPQIPDGSSLGAIRLTSRKADVILRPPMIEGEMMRLRCVAWGIAVTAALLLSSKSPGHADETAELPAHVQDIGKDILTHAKKTWRKDAYISSIALQVGYPSDPNAAPIYSLTYTLYSPSKHLAE